MNKLLSHLLGVAAGALMMPTTHAGTMALWDFSSAQGSQPYLPNSTYTSPGVSGASLSAAAGSFTTVSASGGTLQYSYQGSHVDDLNNATFTLVLTAGSADFSGLSVNLLSTHDGLTGLQGQWSYFQTGASGTFQPIGSSAINLITTTAPTTSIPVNLSAGQELQLRFALSGAVAPGGTVNSSITFDNIRVDFTDVSPVPEPVHYALAAFGFIFVATGARRWCCKRTKCA